MDAMETPQSIFAIACQFMLDGNPDPETEKGRQLRQSIDAGAFRADPETLFQIPRRLAANGRVHARRDPDPCRWEFWL